MTKLLPQIETTLLDTGKVQIHAYDYAWHWLEIVEGNAMDVAVAIADAAKQWWDTHPENPDCGKEDP